MDERVPMRSKRHWIGEDEVQVDVTKGPRGGRRITMDVDETVLSQLGARVIEHAVETLGREFVYRHGPAIEAAVYSTLHDHRTLQPLIEQELRRAVREFILGLWSDEEKKNLRDWFDLFTQKCRGDA